MIGLAGMAVLILGAALSAWVKLTLRCYDPEGKLIWEEMVSGPAHWGREHTGVSRAMEELHKRLNARMQDLQNEPKNKVPAPGTVFTDTTK